MIGKKISPILVEIENTLWEFEANNEDIKPEYTDEGFRATLKIFMSVLMDKMWELQFNEKIDIKDRLNMAEKAGNDLRELVKTYTNIDTHEFYSDNNKTNAR